MLVSSFLFLLLNLSLLKCASTEDQKDVDYDVSETKSERDIFSKHLHGQLLHQVLQYDARSTGRMAKANKDLKSLVKGSRKFRFFEGAGWDMPELANISEFGITDNPALEAEMAKIMELYHIKDESIFNNKLEKLLLKEDAFKELARPVLKYLIRRFIERKENTTDDYFEKRKKFLLFAVENHIYDVLFEYSKDSKYWNGESMEEIIDSDSIDRLYFREVFPHISYFDCYNNYAYNNRAAREHMWSRIKMWHKKTYIPPTECNLDQSTSTDGIDSSHQDFSVMSIVWDIWNIIWNIWNKLTAVLYTEYNLDQPITPRKVYLSERELSAWISVCIYNRVPEEEYVSCISHLPFTFLDIIQDFVCIYSPITSDNNEKDYFHEIVVQLLDKYFEDKSRFEKSVKFIKLLNDIRFGYVNESFYEDRIAPLELKFDALRIHTIMAASKANHKRLVKQMLSLDYYEVPEFIIKKEYPYSFKVYFDSLENDPLQNDNYADYKLINIIDLYNFKITKTTSLPFGDKFYIETPSEYIKHGFDSKYEIIFKRDGFVLSLNSLVEKMFNDAAKAGAEELIHIITEHCGEQVIEPNMIRSQTFTVSYEVVQILLEYRELIESLANRLVRLRCYDNRINPVEIANYRHVIDID